MKKDNSMNEKIVIIDLLYMGDLIFATPFFRQLKKNYPESQIDFIVNSNFYELIEESPYFDNIYPYDKNWSIKKSWKFARELKENNYDLGINIHGNWRTILLMYLIDADFNIGYGGDGKGLFLDKVIETDARQHMVQSYLQFLEKMGLHRFDNDQIELFINQKAKKNMKNLLNEKIGKDNKQRLKRNDKRLIALNTGGTWATKRWPKEKFAKLADKLKAKGEEVLFLGGPSDVERVKEIITLMENKEVINVAGKTTLKELAALTEKCDLVISNDSGPIHVSAAVGTSTIAIFGPSDEKKFRPYGSKHKIVKTDIDCRPCGEHECPLGHHNCMNEIKVNDVIKQIYGQVEGSGNLYGS